MQIRIAEAGDVAWRFVRSFLRREWILSDYPKRITHHTDALKIAKYTPLPWTVAIVNWWHMRGDGETLEEAWTKLSEAFEKRRAEGLPLPRPGTGEEPKIEFADRTLVERYYSIAIDFMPKVLGFEADDCLITDESGLGDFPERDDEYLRRIGIFYGIHPDELSDHRLVTIFARIAQRSSAG